MATTDLVLRQRVKRGAALLDDEEPGWAPRIDVPTLDMGHTEFCILGQTYRYYADGVDLLGLGLYEHLGVYTKAATHGFDHAHSPDDGEYARLLPLWREAIEARCGGSER